MAQAERARCPCAGLDDRALYLSRLARRSDIDGLFEERAFRRVGFIEEGERAEFARGHQSFEREFAAGNVLLHLNGFRLAGNPPDAPDRCEIFVGIVDADHAPAGGKPQRL